MSFDTIAAAITDLKVKGSAKGVSRQAIKAKLGDDVPIARINLCLRKAVAAGRLLQIKGSYKFPSTKKKPASKPATKKKKVWALTFERTFPGAPASAQIDLVDRSFVFLRCFFYAPLAPQKTSLCGTGAVRL